jgi:hypothetical protein
MKRYQAEKPNRFLAPPDDYLWGPRPGKVETMRKYRPGLRYVLRKLGPRLSPLVSTYNPTKII